MLCHAISLTVGAAVWLVYSLYETDPEKTVRRSLSISGGVFLLIGGYNLLSRRIIPRADVTNDDTGERKDSTS